MDHVLILGQFDDRPAHIVVGSLDRHHVLLRLGRTPAAGRDDPYCCTYPPMEATSGDIDRKGMRQSWRLRAMGEVLVGSNGPVRSPPL